MGLPQVHGTLEMEHDVEFLAQSPDFDLEFYEKNTNTLFRTKNDAARHYLGSSTSTKKSPSRDFDLVYYTKRNRDVTTHGHDPFVHYLRHGKSEGRRAFLTRSPMAAPVRAPERSQWANLPSRKNGSSSIDDERSVDVIVPVYRGFDQTLYCLYSVLAAQNKTPFRLTVINDASPDLALSSELEWLSSAGHFEYISNDDNIGFVGTANLGLELSQFRDAILLNSDTVVYGNWIDRLRRHATSLKNVCSVTPLSNNATILSYPHTCEDNFQAFDVEFEDLDRIASRVNAKKRGAVVPTGVGFCFYMPRAALNALGKFNAEVFGRGYGEENDYCMRGAASGWLNLAALDVFVRHHGEASFQGEATGAKAVAQERIKALHPRYERLVQGFIADDPLLEARSDLDVARFATLSGGRGILHIDHGWGGGIDRHIQDLVAKLEGEGVLSLVASPQDGGASDRLSSLSSDDYPNLPAVNWNDTRGAAAVLRSLNIASVHLHSAAGRDYNVVSRIAASLLAAGIPYDVSLHDYMPICPRITMIDWGGAYCASPSASYCQSCIARDGSRFGKVDILDWRERWIAFLSGARRLIAPSNDVAQRYRRYRFDPAPIVIRPHPAISDFSRSDQVTSEENIDYRGQNIDSESLSLRRFAMIGAIGEHKGIRLLRNLCRDALIRRLPLEFIIYGYSNDPAQDDFPNLRRFPYSDSTFGRVLRENPCDATLFLSPWPETFNYALDHALEHALFPIAFDIGAIAERLKNVNFGRLIPISYALRPSDLNDLLLSIKLDNITPPLRESERDWRGFSHHYDV